MRRFSTALVVLAVVIAGTVAGAGLAGAAPAVTVTPSTGLTDGQTVEVTWSGFSTPRAMGIVQCAGDLLLFRCNDTQTVTTSSGQASFAVAAVVDPGGSPVNCRSTGADCAIHVVNVETSLPPFLESASAPIAFSGPSTIGTVTASPDRALFDGDETTATLREWSGADRVELEQCSNILPQCAPLATVNDPGAESSVVVTIRRRIDGPSGTVDCAYQACSLVATGFAGAEATGSASTPLGIGRFGALDWSIDPAMDVADGQVVRVRGEGAVIGDTYTVEQCTGFLDRECDTTNVTSFVAEADGTFDVPITVRARLSSGDDCTDLRVLCVISLTGGEPPNGERDARIVALRRVPIQATPTSGLRDGDTVAVEGRLGAGESVQVRGAPPAPRPRRRPLP